MFIKVEFDDPVGGRNFIEVHQIPLRPTTDADLRSALRFVVEGALIHLEQFRV